MSQDKIFSIDNFGNNSSSQNKGEDSTGDQESKKYPSIQTFMKDGKLDSSQWTRVLKSAPSIDSAVENVRSNIDYLGSINQQIKDVRLGETILFLENEFLQYEELLRLSTNKLNQWYNATTEDILQGAKNTEASQLAVEKYMDPVLKSSRLQSEIKKVITENLINVYKELWKIRFDSDVVKLKELDIIHNSK